MKPRQPSSTTDAVDTMAAAWIIRRDAGLTATESAEFEQWRSSDPSHAAALEAHHRAWSLLDRPGRAGEGEFMREEYRARSARRRQKHRNAAAAVAAVVIGVGLIASLTIWPKWRGQGEISELAAPTAATATVVAPTHRILDDGSHVDLRSGAEIAVAFEPQLRRIALTRGEAHFEVAKNSGRPFVVDAAGIAVRAIGTAFSVQLGPTEIAILVTEGRVRIDRGAHASPSVEPVLVDAGFRLAIPRNRSSGTMPAVAAIAVSASEIDERLLWRKTHLEFSDTPLGEAVALLNRYAAPHGPTRLAIDDPAVAAVPVTGYFRADSLEAFVRLIEASAEIEATRAGEVVTLRKAR